MPKHLVEKEMVYNSPYNGYGTSKKIVEIIETLRQEDPNVFFLVEEAGGGLRCTFKWHSSMEVSG